MGRHLVFDVESDGFLDELTKIHCVVTIDLETGEEKLYRPEAVDEALVELQHADTIIGHNIIEFDIPALEKVYYRGVLDGPTVIDTLCASRTAYAGGRIYEIGRLDSRPDLKRKPHSLEAWGLRLGEPKMESPDSFEEFTADMLTYCAQDVRTNRRLFQHLAKRLSWDVMVLESRVQQILQRLHQHGVAFDVAGALAMVERLTNVRAELTRDLRAAFPAWWGPKDKVVVPKRSQVSRKYKPGELGYRNVAQGCPYQKIELVEFNPASRHHIARVLTKRYGWKPKSWNDDGSAKVDGKILQDLPYREAGPLAKYQDVKKMLGTLSEGEGAWLKYVTDDGFIYHWVKNTGTVTHRKSHARPNLGQVPSRNEYGSDCRKLFGAREGRVLVGVDASGLQLRFLAHYLYPYDAGAFAEAVLDDPHTYMMKGTGAPCRDCQKEYTYAGLFGAGNHKRGTIILKWMRFLQERGELAPDCRWLLKDGRVPSLSAASRIGKHSWEAMSEYITGLQQIQRRLRKAARRGWLRSLDGRRIQVLSEHRALNTLLMGAEAVFMKHAQVAADEALRNRYTPGVDYEFVLDVHDEWQLETLPEIADDVGQRLTTAVRETGKQLGVRCRLDAEYKVGKTWEETH